MTPIADILRGKNQMLRISAGRIDGRQVIDMALLPINGSKANPHKGLAIELESLPALLSVLQMAVAALKAGEV